MPNELEGLNSAALLLCVTFLAYVAMILVPYLRERPGRPGDPDDLAWHFLVPCLNEDKVIERTLRGLLSQRADIHVWCIDDASSDRTAEILQAVAQDEPRVHVVPRFLPDARQGKGPSLNAGWRALSRHLGAGTDRQRVIVGVVDADGRIDPDAYRVLAGSSYFGDRDVGAVQIQVRMVNRGLRSVDADDPAAGTWFARLLVTLQDLEFRTVISAMQILRKHTASVGMGGNGQFTRMCTLDEVAVSAGTPWHGALLEDFELGVHVLLSGARTEFAHETWVAQEGLTSVRTLLRQRSRWGQGAMQCSRYLPAIMTSRRIGTPAAMELGYFLILPWLQLVGTLVYVFGTGVLVFYAATTLGGPGAWLAGGAWGIAPLIILFGIAPFALWGLVYRARCAPHLSRRAAAGLGLANWVYSYAHAVAIWMALFRVVRSRNDWLKTERVVHPTHRRAARRRPRHRAQPHNSATRRIQRTNRHHSRNRGTGMTTKTSMAKRIGAAGASAVILSLMAGPAFAATVAQSSATALEGKLLGQTVVGTGTDTATNDGSTPTVTKTSTGQLQVLPGQRLANDGVLAQTAVANDDGTSAACGGILGEGGTITIGRSGDCTPDNGTSPALLNLASIPLVGTLRLRASAVYASCTANATDATGGFSAQSHLVDTALIFVPAVGPRVVIPITIDTPVVLPAVLSPLVTLELNQVDASGPTTSATALHLTVLGALGGATLTDITIGGVTCGPNATIADTPLIPAAGANLALGTLAIGGLGAFVLYRRRTALARR